MYKSILFFLTVIIVNASQCLCADEPVKILSINVRCSPAKDGENSWIHRRGFMTDIICQGKYDFIGGQEVTLHKKDELNQFRYISGKLPEYAVIGKSRGKIENNGEGVSIWYRKDRWEADGQQQGVFWLSDTPDVAGSITWAGQSICPRIVQWGLFHETDKDGKRTGRGLYFYCTHFDHVGKDARLKSAVMLAKTIAERKEPKYPAVAVGDLNDDEHSPPIRYLHNETVKLGKLELQSPVAFIDTFAHLHPDEKNPATFHGFRDAANRHGRIDYIFVTKGLKPQQADIIRTKNEAGRYPSDHFPVSAVVTFE